ncbi:lytic transglycosylase domain-containing protein [Pseudomonas chlororaphis]|uniref:lytic transglycosylase domain-containing protein n=1 Tax=Pseudomonas chlororaphis TaxID=587753 RepID=UPI002407D294|nr:transglycosylase SLT domain-containing protein [Pseudomonas chlororaphis]
MIALEMIQQCAPNVAPSTMQHIIMHESAGNPLALNINKKKVPVLGEDGKQVIVTMPDGTKKPQTRTVTFKLPMPIKSTQDAVTVAELAIAAGHSVDLSYMQVNSKNLKKLGYSVAQMFDACTNLAAGAEILTTSYAGAAKVFGEGQDALGAALSAYNTGNWEDGYLNGYVANYYPKAAQVDYTLAQQQAPAVMMQDPYTADTTVFSMPRSQPDAQRQPEPKPAEQPADAKADPAGEHDAEQPADAKAEPAGEQPADAKAKPAAEQPGQQPAADAKQDAEPSTKPAAKPAPGLATGDA